MRINRFGGPEVFELVDLPNPVPGPGQVLVAVGAIGVNFAETLMRENRYAVTPELPAVLGSEAAGTVERVGSDVEGVDVGQRVAAPLFAAGTLFGGYADRVLIDARYVVPLPDALPFADATALMVQGLTALLLVERALPRGRTVLVNAAAGGVGSLLVQLAKRAGATTVVAAASTEHKLDLARRLGADAGVNYTQADWPEQLKAATAGVGPGIIYESAGGEVTRASLDALAPAGEIVIYGALNIQDFHLGVPELTRLIFRNQSLTGFSVSHLLTPPTLRSNLARLFELAVDETLEVRIGATYPLERAGAAHCALAERRTTGKIVLLP